MGHIEEIVQDAKSYIGQEEITPNLGFKNPTFNAKMNDAGFYSSASWCGFFVIMVMKQVYNDGSGIWAWLGAIRIQYALYYSVNIIVQF